MWDGTNFRNKVYTVCRPMILKRKWTGVRRVYLEILTPDQRKSVENDSDDRIAEAAFFCAASWVTLQDDAKSRRKLIDEQWKPSR